MSSFLIYYRDCSERLYSFSPSVHVDQTWQAVKDYQEQIMKLKKHQHNNCSLITTIQKIYNIWLTLNTQLYYIWQTKSKYLILYINYRWCFVQITVVLSRHSKLLHSLYTHARHFGISTIALTQKFAAVGQIIRVSSTLLCVCRLRNTNDWECV